MAIEEWGWPLSEALLNGLWQGAVVVGMAEAGMRLLGRGSAVARYTIWCVVFAVATALPFAHYASAALERDSAFAASSRTAPALVTPAPGAAPVPTSTARQAMPVRWSVPIAAVSGVMAVLAPLMLVGLARAVALLLSLVSLRQLRRSSAPPPPLLQEALAGVLRSHGRRGVEVRVSATVATPSTVGFLRPLVLLPSLLVPVLSDEDWRHIVLHELAHVLRYDDWVCLVQRMLERLFFYVPAVAWAGWRLDLEREMACDEFAARASGRARSYAAALTRVAEATRRPSLALAPGAIARPSQLARRVERLLAAGDNAGGVRGVGLLAVGVALVATCGGLPLLPRVTIADDIERLTPAVVRAPGLNDLRRGLSENPVGPGEQVPVETAVAVETWSGPAAPEVSGHQTILSELEERVRPQVVGACSGCSDDAVRTERVRVASRTGQRPRRGRSEPAVASTGRYADAGPAIRVVVGAWSVATAARPSVSYSIGSQRPPNGRPVGLWQGANVNDTPAWGLGSVSYPR